jgi:hypothetical protein
MILMSCLQGIYHQRKNVFFPEPVSTDVIFTGKDMWVDNSYAADRIRSDCGNQQHIAAVRAYITSGTLTARCIGMVTLEVVFSAGDFYIRGTIAAPGQGA